MHCFLIIIIITILCFGSAAKSTWSTGSVVEYLPGFHGPLPFHLETGYVGVDENEDVQLFYYFIRSESNPDHDPLLLWLTGGPGCSSISGLLYEIGPIQFEAVSYNGSLPTLFLNPNSWTKTASIIFLDIPVGTGFSYARTKSASYSTEFQFFDQAYEFMRKWLESHPEFISNPLYVAGDSYSGISVPVITQLISNGNEAGTKPYINLKGYVLGNPRTFPEERNYHIGFANGMGLISDELYKSLLRSCDGEYTKPKNAECDQNLRLYQECINGIEKAQVLEPVCEDDVTSIKLPSQKHLKQNSLFSSFECRAEGYTLSEYWLGDASVNEALHIQKGTIGDWIRCSEDLKLTITLADVRPYHLNLSKKSYRSLIYSGDHDLIIPHQSTQAWITELNYSVVEKWRSWKFQGQIAGYTESYSNGMTFATVKGAGHTAPEYKPEQCFAMFKSWISDQPL